MCCGISKFAIAIFKSSDSLQLDSVKMVHMFLSEFCICLSLVGVYMFLSEYLPDKKFESGVDFKFTSTDYRRLKNSMRDQMDSEDDIHKLRPLHCELGNLTRPDGSAVLSQGDTCIISAVYGPGEVRMNKEQLDKATVEVVYKPKSGLPGCVDKSRERIIRNTCETVLIASLHPRSSISITVQELQDSGSYLATCLNSACLALLDSSVSMKCLVGAVHCCISDNGEIILDPTHKGEAGSSANMTFAFDSRDKNVITVVANGKFSKDQFEKCLVTCREASSAVFAFFKETVQKKMSKSV